MICLTTNGITIEVITRYEDKYSIPSEFKFAHSYQISIINTTIRTVQLLSRKWIITDSNHTQKIVEGNGVVGVQPLIEPKDSHVYTSWCPLRTSVGKMSGTFTMLDVIKDTIFEVEIPSFPLVADFRLN